MPAAIHAQTIPAAATIRDAFVSKPLLLGEIEGVSTFFCGIGPRKTHAFKALPDKVQILFFLEGQGHVATGGTSFLIKEMSLFIPALGSGFSIEADKTPLSFLAVHWDLRKDDEKDLEAGKKFLPYFIAYSACKTYREAIKSPKTVNRTLVPENVVPRFCMGSVETQGPDGVGAHKHPMLEQHFFGLEGNDCMVRADDAEIRLTGNMLLHIPLGSEHSVRVEAGKKLHYLWLDFFKDKKGVEWITQMHKQDK